MRRESSAFDEKPGVTVYVKLQKTYFHDDVILTILPNCPSYLSSLKTTSESLNAGRIRMKNSALKCALN